MPWQWAAFTSWAGLRGAVPIIFATIPLGMGTPHGHLIFNVTLLLVIVLTLVQSPTMPMLARRLGLVRPEQPGELSVEAAPLDSMQAALLDLDVPGGVADRRYVHLRAAAAAGRGDLAGRPRRARRSCPTGTPG